MIVFIVELEFVVGRCFSILLKKENNNNNGFPEREIWCLVGMVFLRVNFDGFVTTLNETLCASHCIRQCISSIDLRINTRKTLLSLFIVLDKTWSSVSNST